MRRALFCFFLLAGCEQSVQVPVETALPAARSEAEVRAVLGARHFDADAADVRALAEGSAPTLVSLAESASEPSIVRIRAALALRHQSTDAAKHALVRLATAPETTPGLARSSIDTLARAYARTDLPLVLDTCTALASSPDESVRRAASAAEIRARVGALRAP